MSNNHLDISGLSRFVAECRDNGLSDEKIVQLAKSSGQWDDNFVQAFVYDNNDSSKKVFKPKNNKNNQDDIIQLSPVMMVIHHIVLWFFLTAAFPLVIVLINVIFNSNWDSYFMRDSIAPIVSFIVVVFILGGLYGSLLFWYMRKLRDIPSLRTGKIFSLIIMAFSLIAVISSIITIIVSIILFLLNTSEENTFPMVVVLAALSYTLIYGSILVTYHATDFMKVTIDNNGENVANPKRKTTMIISTLVLFSYLVLLTIIAMSIIPAISHDARIIDSIENYAKNVHNVTKNNNRLPTVEEMSQINANSDIIYTPISSYDYELCAEFKRSTDTQSRNENNTSGITFDEYNSLDHGENDEYPYLYDKPYPYEQDDNYSCYKFYNQDLLHDYEDNQRLTKDIDGLDQLYSGLTDLEKEIGLESQVITL